LDGSIGKPLHESFLACLVELVNDVLDLSKIEAGKLTLEPEPVAMGELLDDLLSTIRPMAEERGCPVVVDAARCTRTVHTDPRRVRQILLNLLSNATRFGAHKPIVMRCADTDAGVTVEIIDRGPGIAQEDISRIFEEFVQLDGRGDEGTGLGLAISRRLADLLGGRLEVDSRLGQGSTFRLVLPRAVRAS
jgi:signal transduction histidine kinase